MRVSKRGLRVSKVSLGAMCSASCGGCLRFGVFGDSLWGPGLGVPVAWPAAVTPGPALCKGI